MKAYILQLAGDSGNLQLADIEAPKVKEEEVLIKTKAISINPVDFKTRKSEEGISRFFKDKRPVILGWDLAGVVKELGSKVTSFKVGDEVYGMVNFPGAGNTYAEYVAAPVAHLALKPNSISFEEAAAGTLAALTAWQSVVTYGKVKKGDKVLIHAASGGVGHYAVQIAKHLGAYVIGTSSAKNRDFVLALGADEHIDYQTQKFEEIVKNADFILDPIAQENLTRSIEVVKPGGRVIVLPSSLGVTEDNKNRAEERGVKVELILVRSNGEDMQKIANLMREGIVKSHIYKRYKFEDMPLAHQELEKGRTVGKIVLSF